jgi:2-polyprenyl-3-methyl-5-hydroxy-6-metoxy-1,4-benzoquinol methylase
VQLKVTGRDNVSLCIVIRREDACSPRNKDVRHFSEFARQQDALSLQGQRQNLKRVKKICVHPLALIKPHRLVSIGPVIKSTANQVKFAVGKEWSGKIQQKRKNYMAIIWTKERIEDLLKRENFTYQRIELPFGLATDGADRSATARAIFPESLKGKSVLDIGCNNGFFCYEAARRGAARVVGLDVEPDMIRKNRVLADVLGVDVEFKVADLDREKIVESFDYVLCLNVLHHLRYPLYTLDNLAEITRERLVLEMASFGLADCLRMGILPVLSPVISRLPITFVSPGHAGKKLKRFIISQSAIRNFLMTHRRIFSSCELAPSEFKGRYLVKAEKYAVDHLIVVAGPTGSGTARFADDFARGGCEGAAKALKVDGGAIARFPFAKGSRAKVSVMDYDLLNPFMRTGNVYSRDVELDILSVAEKVSFVTLKPTVEELRQNYEKQMRRGRLFGKPSKRERKILESYTDEQSLAALYRPWFDFLENRGDNSIVVETNSDGHSALRVEARPLVLAAA